jgi:hypothetical protein
MSGFAFVLDILEYMEILKKKYISGIFILLLSVLACQPVFAVGWREILFVIIVAAFLLGPPIYRFFRRLENHRKPKDE